MATTVGTTYVDSAASAGSHTWTVTAVDSSGNESAASNPETATVAAAVTSVTGTNLYASTISTMSGGASLWGGGGAGAPVLASATTPVLSGTTSLQVTPGNTGHIYVNPSSGVAIGASSPATCLISIYCPVTTNVGVSINWSDSSHTAISTSTGTVVSVPANTWTQVLCTATSPSNAAHLQPVVEIGSPVAVAPYYLDQLGAYASASVNTWNG